ncbi:MAG: hypothetical protein ABFR90_11325 [Planctomycetota bacterium]
MSKEKQNKSSLKFWLLIVAVMLLPIGLLVLYRVNRQSEFDRRVAALAKEGYPVSLDDLEKRYVLPEGAENAADIYIEAFSCHWQPTGDEKEFLPTCGNYKWPDDVPPFPQEVMDALESYLQRNQETLELLDKAAAMEHCIWPRSRDSCWLNHDHLLDIRRAAQLLSERNLYLAQKGESGKLFDSLQTSIGLSKAFSKQSFLIDYLVTASLKAICVGALEDIMSQTDFTEAQLEMLQKQFAEMRDMDALHDAFIVDRCSTIEFWRLPPDEQAPHSFSAPSMPARLLYSASGLKQTDALLSLDYMEKSIAASQLPLHRRDAAFKKVENEMDSGILSFVHLYLNAITMPMTRVNQIDLRCMGNLKCAETALAIRRYRRKYHALPDSLEALVPEFMAELPRDPFDNEVIRYLKPENGFTLYIIGEDGIDNGGKSKEQLRKKTGERPKQYDWPFTVRW